MIDLQGLKTKLNFHEAITKSCDQHGFTAPARKSNATQTIYLAYQK